MALDKTEAVNLMLAAVGEQPTTSGEVSSPTQPETVKAVRILDDVSRTLQLEGWSFNKDLDVELVPSGGVIAIPAGVISIEPLNRGDKVAIRYDSGTAKLWDREESTFTFTRNVRVNTVKELDFADLPIHARMYCAKQAARIFAEQYLGEAQPALRDDETRAQASFWEAEIAQGDHRLSDSYDIWRTAGRVSPLDHRSG